MFGFVQEGGGCRLHIPPSGTTETVMIHLHCPVEQHAKNEDAFFCSNVPSVLPLISTHSLTERSGRNRGTLEVGHMKKHHLILEGYLCFHWTEGLRNKEETQAKASPTQREQILYRTLFQGTVCNVCRDLSA